MNSRTAAAVALIGAGLVAAIALSDSGPRIECRAADGDKVVFQPDAGLSAITDDPRLLGKPYNCERKP